ncbi:unnamed protein product, partial [Aphanomyces euteiches]
MSMLEAIEANLISRKRQTGKRQHTAKVNPRANETCSYCLRKGHKTEKCFLKKKHSNDLENAKQQAKDIESNNAFDGIPRCEQGNCEQSEGSAKSDELGNWKWVGAAWAHEASLVQGKIGDKFIIEWVIDSGATYHMCFVREMFSSLELPEPGTTSTV